MDKDKLIVDGGTIHSPSTAATKNNSANNGEGNQLSEDVFRMIENSNSHALKKLLSESAIHINRSTCGSSLDGSAANVTPQKKDSSTTARFSCMRMDRHFSALVFACYTNQPECLQILFEHGKELTSDNHDTFVLEWLGGQVE